MRWLAQWFGSPSPPTLEPAPNLKAQAEVPASLACPPPLPHPDRAFVMAAFNAYRRADPATSWSDFIQTLKYRHTVAAEEVAKRHATLAQLQAKTRSRP